MPIWEHYQVKVETKVTVLLSNGQPVSQFTTFGEAKGGSNEDVNEASITTATVKAMKQAAEGGVRMAAATRMNRRSELGYKDGD